MHPQPLSDVSPRSSPDLDVHAQGDVEGLEGRDVAARVLAEGKEAVPSAGGPNAEK